MTTSDVIAIPKIPAPYPSPAMAQTKSVNTKICSICCTVKDLGEFRNGRRQCKDCLAKRDQLRYMENCEEIKKRKHEWVEANREEVNRRQRLKYESIRDQEKERKHLWYMANRERVAEHDRRYVSENREKVNERLRIYWENHKEQRRELRRRYEAANREQRNEHSRQYQKARYQKLKEEKAEAKAVVGMASSRGRNLTLVW
jgi:hypothetical protein